MDRRRFLKTLLATVSALLVAPGAVVEHLVSPFIPGRRYDHFAMSWDGDPRRTWIDGEEVFGGNVQSCNDVTIDGGFYQAIGSDQGGISFWIAPRIPWTRMSDDSPFEPPLRTDPPPTIESDVGEGEDLVYSWW